jgi:hypothetical protein
MSAPTDPVEALIVKWRNEPRRLRGEMYESLEAGEARSECADELEAALKAAANSLASRANPQEDEHLPFRGLTDAQRMVLRHCFRADGQPKTVYENGVSCEGDPRGFYWCDVHDGFHYGEFRDGDGRKPNQSLPREASPQEDTGLITNLRALAVPDAGDTLQTSEMKGLMFLAADALSRRGDDSRIAELQNHPGYKGFSVNSLDDEFMRGKVAGWNSAFELVREALDSEKKHEM